MAAAEGADEGEAAAAPRHVPALLADELSSGTLSALQEFLQERARAEEAAAAGAGTEDALFAEDWGMSQFWYTDETAGTVAEEVLERSRGGTQPIACIACPSLFREIRRRCPAAAAHLLEFDTRFAACGDSFCFYDYNEPLSVPARIVHAFTVVVADPPYLSEECLQKTAQTMRLLATESGPSYSLLLTGGPIRPSARWRVPCRRTSGAAVPLSGLKWTMREGRECLHQSIAALECSGNIIWM